MMTIEKRIVVILALSLFLLLVVTKTKGGQDLLKQFSVITKSTPGVTQEVTADGVIRMVNGFRGGNKLSVLSKNDNLEKAALARLTVIEASQDYSGSLTGISLENATKNNGYSYSVVGELDAVNVLPGIDLATNWASNAAEVKLLKDNSFKEIGVAVKQNGIGFDVVVIMAKPMSAAAPAAVKKSTWGGIELWNAINKRRVELGVNPLSQREELCTLASIRLNQLLDLGKLDGHAGLEPTLNRPDLAYLRDKYTIAEFLVYGYSSAEDSVKAWENTLGHRELLSGGQYVWGCAYAQNTFGVAIAAY